MRGKWKRIIACAVTGALLCGCAAPGTSNPGETEKSTGEITGQSAEESVQESIQASAEGIRKVITITEVFGDGQKPSAAALEYPGEIDASSLSAEDFEVEGQIITDVFTNSEAAITERNIAGNYVILKFAYENSESAESMSGGPDRGNRDGGADGGLRHGGDGSKGEEVDGGTLRGNSSPDGGADRGPGGAGGNMSRQKEVNLSAVVVQKGEVKGTDGTVYPGNDAAVESSERIDLVLQDFQLLEYTDPETGCTIPYSLFLPENYDESKEYPLLFFVADASANGDDLTRNLTQGNGAVIWASPEEQEKRECIVLSPQYTNTLIDSIGALTTDDNVWSDGLTLVSNLLQYVIETYRVDENRIYGTGQSQGCMTNIALSDRDPELFAAQFLVAGQWDVEEMSAMKDKNLWIMVCEGDTKAYPGMNAATENWESLGASVARSEMWDSKSSPEEFDELVKQMEDQNCRINYTVLEGGNHTYTWSVAYNIEGIREWLFAQTRE